MVWKYGKDLYISQFQLKLGFTQMLCVISVDTSYAYSIFPRLERAPQMEAPEWNTSYSSSRSNYNAPSFITCTIILNDEPLKTTIWLSASRPVRFLKTQHLSLLLKLATTSGGVAGEKFALSSATGCKAL